MSAAPRDPYSRAGRRQTLRYLAKAGALKVCHGCDRPVAASTVACPSCRAYRFDDDRAAVDAAVVRATARKGWREEILRR